MYDEKKDIKCPSPPSDHPFVKTTIQFATGPGGRSRRGRRAEAVIHELLQHHSIYHL